MTKWEVRNRGFHILWLERTLEINLPNFFTFHIGKRESWEVIGLAQGHTISSKLEQNPLSYAQSSTLSAETGQVALSQGRLSEQEMAAYKQRLKRGWNCSIGESEPQCLLGF